MTASHPAPRGSECKATRSLAEVVAPDIIVVPGGFGAGRLLDHEPVLSWLRTVHESSAWTTSVCLDPCSSRLPGCSTATTHWVVRERLGSLGARPVADRVVRHGKIITAAGVSSVTAAFLTLETELLSA